MNVAEVVGRKWGKDFLMLCEQIREAESRPLPEMQLGKFMFTQLSRRTPWWAHCRIMLQLQENCKQSQIPSASRLLKFWCVPTFALLTFLSLYTHIHIIFFLSHLKLNDRHDQNQKINIKEILLSNLQITRFHQWSQKSAQDHTSPLAVISLQSLLIWNSTWVSHSLSHLVSFWRVILLNVPQFGFGVMLSHD